MSKKYFGTDGIRGVANKELTVELAFKVARAGAYVLSKYADSKPTILIGKDTRISGDMLESAMVAGFCSFGANVKILGVIPTPAVAYLVKKYNATAGVVISASHNPYEFNGIKFFNNKGTKLADSIEEEIEGVMDSGELDTLLPENENIGKYEIVDSAQKDYEEFLCEIIGKKIDVSNIKVGLDTSNGATYKVAEETFKSLNIKYKIINNTPNGININKDCGSTHIEYLQKFVVDNNLDLGLAFDGDGDRCLAVDSKGNLVDGDKILAIIGTYLNSEGKLNKSTIVATVMSNIGFSKFAKENDILLEKTKVGDRYVLECMQSNGYNLGGEQSGHVILLDYNPTGDGILTGLKLIEVITNTKKDLYELSNKIKTYPQVLVNAKVENTKKYDYEKDEQIVDKINELEKKFAGNGRVLIRPSGTEPLVRVMIEGEDQDYITKQAAYLASFIEQRLSGNK